MNISANRKFGVASPMNPRNVNNWSLNPVLVGGRIDTNGYGEQYRKDYGAHGDRCGEQEPFADQFSDRFLVEE